MPTKTPIRHQGNDSLFLALEMSLICTAAGIPLHVHAEGLRGTGKTTVMRWASQMAPRITRVKGCVYQCWPDLPHCPNHLGTGSQGQIETENVPMPFVEIGHGAKLGTILGSVDLAGLTDPHNPKAALLPGSIPMANRGIVFIDEINRLAETAPEITDVLLSVMGTKPGKIKIEEVGLEPWEIQVNSSVWATSNPDEDPGPLEEIRRQLADRFDLVVPVHRPSDPLVIQELLMSKYQTAPAQRGNVKLSGSIQQAAVSLRAVTVPRPIVKYMADLYVEYNIESLRAIESLELASRCLAAIRGKPQVSFDEISTVMPLVLRHRTEPMVLSEILKDLELRKAPSTGLAGDQAQQKSAGGLNLTSSQQCTSGTAKVPEPQAGAQEASSKFPPDGIPGRQGSPADLPPASRQVPEATESSIDHRQVPAFHKVQEPPGYNGHKPVSWLEWLFGWRYRNNPGQTLCQHHGNQYNRAGNGTGSRKTWGTHAKFHHTSQTTSSEGNRLHPASPVSPPEAARPISQISWEQVLLPPEWKDRQK